MYLIFDTETTGLPKRWDAPVSDSDNWPRCIQIAWQLHDRLGNLVDHQDYLIQPEGFDIPFESEKIHGISTALAQQEGVPLAEALEAFSQALEQTTFLVGQNVGFDLNIVGAEYWRLQGSDPLPGFPVLDTCTEETAELCQIPGGRGGKFKKPTLTELHEHLFGQAFNEAHNATADVEATTRCFLELLRKKHYPLQQLKEEANYYQEFEAGQSGRNRSCWAEAPKPQSGLRSPVEKSRSRTDRDQRNSNSRSQRAPLCPPAQPQPVFDSAIHHEPQGPGPTPLLNTRCQPSP